MIQLLLALAFALLSASALAWTHGISTAPPPLATSMVMPIGAGGWIVGLQIAADGTRFGRTDTYGAWVWDTTLSPPTWRQVVTVSSMPANQVGEDIAAGVYEIAIAPTNTQHLWMYFNGYVFKSADFGKHWTQTAFAQVPANPNAQCARLFGHFMAIDPSNESNVFVGTPTSGMFVTHDGGATWAAVPTVPGANKICGDGGGNIILFVTSSHLFAGSYGNGIYESTNGGASWTIISSSILHPSHMAWSSAGGLFVTDETTTIHQYNSGSWTSVTVGVSARGIAIDPANSNRIAVVDATFGYIQTSTDLGVTWSARNTTPPIFGSNGPPVVNGFATGANDIPWLAWAQNGGGDGTLNAALGMSSGDIAFDPTQTNVLYQGAGVGVWYGSPDDSGANMTWTSQSRGIEQLVAGAVVSIPGGSVQTASGDRYTSNAGPMLTWPDHYSPRNAPTIGYGVGWTHNIDYNWSNPATLVALMNSPFPQNGPEQLSSYSLDGGVNWILFNNNGVPSPPTPEANGIYGGSIATDDQGDVVVIPCGTQAYHSVIPGAAWVPVLPSTNYWCYYDPSPSGNKNWWFLYHKIIVSDRNLSKTFYAYNWVDGVYKSIDGGLTWTLIRSGPLDAGNTDAFNATLRVNPKVAGDLFFTAGDITPSGNPTPNPMWHSLDGGVTWTQVPHVLEVRHFGFGAPAPGQSVGALYMNGWADCSATTIVCNPFGAGYRYGLYQSVDDGATFVQVGTYLNNSFDKIHDLNGDVNSYGRFYAALQGSGFSIGVTPDAVLKPIVALESVDVSIANQATIAWATDATATNSIDYGTTVGYGSHAAASSGLNPSVTLTGLANYTTYHYRANSGAGSSMDLTFLTKNTVAPGPPFSLTATAVNDTQINLSWAASTPGPQPIAGYHIYSSGTLVGTTTGPGTTFAFNGAPSTAYSFTVAAYDATPNISPQSGAATVTTPPPGVQWAATSDGGGIIAQTALTTAFSAALGAAASQRQTLVCATVANGAGNPTPVEHITGVTLDSGSGPVAMTQIADASATGGAFDPAAIKLYQLATPTGTLGTVVVTTDALVTGGGHPPSIGVTVGRLVTGTPLASATKVAQWACQATLPVCKPATAINVPAFGVAVMCGGSLGNIEGAAGGPPYLGTWTSGTVDLTTNPTPPAYWWSTLAHLYFVGNQFPAITGANGFGMAVGAWSP